MATQIRPLAAAERAALAGRLRSLRRRRLQALRDVAAVAELGTFCGIAYSPGAVAAVQAAFAGSGDLETSFRIAVAAMLVLALFLTSRTAWLRMAIVRGEVRALRRDLGAGLAEEIVHRIVEVRVVGTAQAGWFCAFLEDDRGRTLFIQAMPDGHGSEELAATFPPALVRFEHALHSGHRFAESREGPFGGKCALLELEDVPRGLPVHGTVFEAPLAEVEARLLGIGRS